MPRYFADTSALAKLYRRETGSDIVERIFTEPGSQLIISRLAVVEMESVLAIKIRVGEISQRAASVARRRLDADLGRRRLLVASVHDEHLRAARRLLLDYGVSEGLRTLDALQLAVAIGLKQAGLLTAFLAADQRLCRVAVLAGFAVTNPERPAPPALGV